MVKIKKGLAKKSSKSSGPNCGIGSGGFKSGNTCAKGGAKMTVDEVPDWLPKGTKVNFKDPAFPEWNGKGKVGSEAYIASVLDAVAAKYKFPATMYHVTSEENSAKIDKGGLKTGQTRTTQTGKIRGVYLASDVSSIYEGGDFNPRNPVPYAVKTAKLKLKFDPEFYPDVLTPSQFLRELKDDQHAIMVYSEKPIPKSAITKKRMSYGERNIKVY